MLILSRPCGCVDWLLILTQKGSTSEGGAIVMAGCA